MAFEAKADVYHANFGSGVVEAAEGDRHVVRFAAVGTRKVLTSQLQPMTFSGVKAARQVKDRPPVEAATAPKLAPGALKVVNAASLAGKIVPAREWHVRDLIPAGTVTILGGDGGTGKSLLAMQLAFATAVHAQWIGNQVATGRCLYLSAEDDLDELHRRLATISAEVDVPLDDLDNLDIVPLAGEDAILAVADGRTNILKTTPLFAALEARIVDTAPVLTVLDTLADLFGGEENQRAQVRQFIGLLRGWAIKHRTTVLLLAHPSLAGMANGSGSSGSTAWNNSVRSRLYLRREATLDNGKLYEPDANVRMLETVKANYGKAGATLRLRWDAGIFRALESAPFGSLNTMAAENHADHVFLSLVAIFAAEGRPVGPSAGPNYAPAIFERDARSEGISKRGFADAMSRLFASNKIAVKVSGPASRQRSHIVLANLE